jgi:hypothetical protein
MTAAQAAAWNRGDATRETMAGAYVSIPRTYGGGSYVRDGQIEMVQGLPYDETMSLWDYIGGDEGESEEYLHMDGCPANLIRE